MSISRRYFLKTTGLSLFGTGFVPSFLRRTAFAAEQPGRKKILVAIFQRGAADGLNIVVPYGEKNYYAMRPSMPFRSPPSGATPARAPWILTGSLACTPALPL